MYDENFMKKVSRLVFTSGGYLSSEICRNHVDRFLVAKNECTEYAKLSEQLTINEGDLPDHKLSTNRL